MRTSKNSSAIFKVMNTKRKGEIELSSLFWTAPVQKYLCFAYGLNNELYINGINFITLEVSPALHFYAQLLWEFTLKENARKKSLRVHFNERTRFLLFLKWNWFPTLYCERLVKWPHLHQGLVINRPSL